MLNFALIGAVSIGLFANCPQLAFAYGTQPIASPATQDWTAEFGSLKNCAQATHNCELCVAGQDGHVTCSSVGIACVPTEWRCLTPAKQPSR
jgi:hypothetical protein